VISPVDSVLSCPFRKEILYLAYTERDVSVCMQGYQPFMAAVQAVYDTRSGLREGTPAERLVAVASDDMMKQIKRNPLDAGLPVVG